MIKTLTNDSDYDKLIVVFLASSTAERSAVNRNVGGSNPPRGVSQNLRLRAYVARSLFHAVGGSRTPDALLRTEALYPLSYDGGVWKQCARRDLNSRPTGPQPAALSAELRAQNEQSETNPAYYTPHL